MSGITQTQCTIFKQNLLSGLENFAAGTPYTYKLALYANGASLDSTTTAYTTVGEITGTGYIAGGATITPIGPASDTSSNTAYISFQTVTWNPASFTCVGGLIYNATTNAAVCVLSFGSIRTASNLFTVQFPTPAATTAIIRLN